MWMGSHYFHVAGYSLPWSIAAPLIVAATTTLVTLVSAFIRWALKATGAWWDQIIVECPIKLGWLADALKGTGLTGYSLHCLLVRYGDDKYLQNMASDQERYEGRLRNRVINIALDGDKTKLALPVHTRLGTQFKLYIKLRSGTDAKMLYKQAKYGRSNLAAIALESSDDFNNSTIRQSSEKGLSIEEGSAPPPPTHTVPEDQVTAEGHGVPPYILLDDEEPKGKRLWFRLAGFGGADSVEGYSNNMCGASDLIGFESTHKLGRIAFWTPRRGKLDLL